MKDRWIALYVENQVGVLAKVSGLFSGKAYNLQSLTVGTTEDETVSRMTICVTSDDITFEQIKKQLNRMVEVIKVIDLTEVPIHMKEILFAKVLRVSAAEKEEVFQIAQVFNGFYLTVFFLMVEPSRTDRNIALCWCPLVAVFPSKLQLFVVFEAWIDGVGWYCRPAGFACKSIFISYPSASRSAITEKNGIGL